MKTIEERAKEFARYQETPWSTISFDQKKFEYYMVGAIEQQNIDIERAWQWMRQHIKLIGSEMELHSQFVKAMKGEGYETTI